MTIGAPRPFESDSSVEPENPPPAPTEIRICALAAAGATRHVSKSGIERLRIMGLPVEGAGRARRAIILRTKKRNRRSRSGDDRTRLSHVRIVRPWTPSAFREYPTIASVTGFGRERLSCPRTPLAPPPDE